jgi:hypothetical protein
LVPAITAKAVVDGDVEKAARLIRLQDIASCPLYTKNPEATANLRI